MSISGMGRLMIPTPVLSFAFVSGSLAMVASRYTCMEARSYESGPTPRLCLLACNC